MGNVVIGTNGVPMSMCGPEGHYQRESHYDKGTNNVDCGIWGRTITDYHGPPEGILISQSEASTRLTTVRDMCHRACTAEATCLYYIYRDDRPSVSPPTNPTWHGHDCLLKTETNILASLLGDETHWQNWREGLDIIQNGCVDQNYLERNLFEDGSEEGLRLPTPYLFREVEVLLLTIFKESFYMDLRAHWEKFSCLFEELESGWRMALGADGRIEKVLSYMRKGQEGEPQINTQLWPTCYDETRCSEGQGCWFPGHFLVNKGGVMGDYFTDEVGICRDGWIQATTSTTTTTTWSFPGFNLRNDPCEYWTMEYYCNIQPTPFKCLAFPCWIMYERYHWCYTNEQTGAHPNEWICMMLGSEPVRPELDWPTDWPTDLPDFWPSVPIMFYDRTWPEVYKSEWMSTFPWDWDFRVDMFDMKGFPLTYDDSRTLPQGGATNIINNPLDYHNPTPFCPPYCPDMQGYIYDYESPVGYMFLDILQYYIMEGVIGKGQFKEYMKEILDSGQLQEWYDDELIKDMIFDRFDEIFPDGRWDEPPLYPDAPWLNPTRPP